MKLEQIAEIAHEANRAYCRTLGDDSHPSWAEAPDWQKESIRKGVEFLWEYPDAYPSDNHENWLKEKQADGWVFGETKDPDKKTHPCMRPYKELPEAQRVKDTLFNSLVKGLITHVQGFVYPLPYRFDDPRAKRVVDALGLEWAPREPVLPPRVKLLYIDPGAIEFIFAGKLPRPVWEGQKPLVCRGGMEWPRNSWALVVYRDDWPEYPFDGSTLKELHLNITYERAENGDMVAASAQMVDWP